ncbi:hypothetical protein [Ulvibacterium sp.]|uniref:hypothetical protein n=1 Tax=Ulvibacterium sp. TaxID=2665914 RepID=UPI002631B132|nr:hypothetical protein [Ulvibacterium sp.]
MKKILILFTGFILLAIGQICSQEIDEDGLETGWYFETRGNEGIEKELFKSGERLVLNPAPIVKIKDFDELELYVSVYGTNGLSIRFKEGQATEDWISATEKAHIADLRLGLVINNELICALTIASPISAGISAINRDDLTKAELEEFKRKLEMEKKHQ